MTITRPAPPETARTQAYRDDIDGLRALAILLVVVYHVWLGRVSGGVDVFLMVSAFFLTASFVRRIDRGAPLALGSFWIRRFRRLVPAAAVTILLILGAALALFPQTEWPRIWREGWASLFYAENWALAFSEVDYYARDAVTPSPFQHFWSLSVQGQVFVLWPLVILIIATVLRQRRRAIVPALTVCFTAIFLASLVFSIVETATAQSFAYFDTRTRLWEFAAGSLVALALPYLRLSAWVSALLGWLGVVGIVVCGIVLDVQGGFPGYLALWPVVCTAFVIVGGNTPSRWGPGMFLASKPLSFLGRDAYALYLVHWPILITWMVVTGRSHPGWLSGLSIIGLSLVIARLISWGIEAPLRNSATLEKSRARGILAVLGAVLVVAVPLGSWQALEAARASTIAAASEEGYPGAAQVDTPVDLGGVDLPLKPAPTALDSEWVSLDKPCSDVLAPMNDVLDGSCTQNAHAGTRSSPLVLVMGDSHAQQLMSPLKVLAHERGWGMTALLKGGCSIGVGAPSWSASGPSCDDWRQAAIDYALELKPDAVYMVVTRADPTQPEVVVEGVEDVITRLEAAGIQVIGVRDNPRFSFDMYECVVSESGECTVTPPDADAAAIAEIFEKVIPVDFTHWLCPEGRCGGEVGNVAVYLDDNHITDSYGRTLAPMLADMLAARGSSLTNGATGAP